MQYNGTRTYNNMIKDFCKANGCTTFAFAVAAYKVLLYKYSGLKDLTIGSPISGRVNSQLENQVGLYINTIPIRSQFTEEHTFSQVLRNEHENIKLSHDNQLFSMDDLLKRLDIQTPIGHSPIFDIMMAYQNQTTLKMYNSDNISEIEVRPAPGNGPNIPFAQFDLGLGMGEYKDEIIVTAQYNSDVYEEEHIEGMMEDYIFLMEALINRPQVSIETFLAECGHEFVTDREIIFTTLSEVSEEEQEAEEALAEAEVRGPENPYLKSAIQEIIQKYVADLPVHEDYFAKGGNSLGAIQAINDINQTFKTRLSIIDFYNNASINKMHDLMYTDFVDWKPAAAPEVVAEPVAASNGKAKEQEEEVDFVLEYGRVNRELPSMFLFPPIVGTGLVFRSLAKDALVQEEFNTYAFDMPLVSAEENIIEAVAEKLYGQIRKRLYNEDTVYLVGYSVGVHPAFEIARLLERDGRNVVLLMLDRGPEMNEDYEVNDEYVQQLIANHEPILTQLINAGAGTREVVEARIFQTLKGLKQYGQPQKINSPIFSFEAKKNWANGYMVHWEKYTRSSHELQHLEGSHFEALSPTNIAIISQTLKKAINEKASIY